MTRLLSALAAASALGWGAQQPPPFRSGTESVSISVTVKRGNAAVANLAAKDFRLFDSGVPQMVEVITIESVPLDVTLFMDTSGSTSRALDRMKANVGRISALLRPDDRFRLLTIGLSVDVAVPWRQGHEATTLDMPAVTGISLIYDALFVGLAHTPAAGRRHLVVALTDGRDCGSVIDGPKLLGLSGRSEAVLHWVRVEGQGDFPRHAVPAWCTPVDEGAVDYLGQAAQQSGGATHRSTFGDRTVTTVAEILAEFRQSYVLQYSPAGVTTGGWHPVRVDVPGVPGARVSARAGYVSVAPSP